MASNNEKDPSSKGDKDPGPNASETKSAQKTRRQWLDAEYTFEGKDYGPSRFPGDLIEVPAHFPKDKGGKEPKPEEWVPRPVSAVKEVAEIDDKAP